MIVFYAQCWWPESFVPSTIANVVKMMTDVENDRTWDYTCHRPYRRQTCVVRSAAWLCKISKPRSHVLVLGSHWPFILSVIVRVLPWAQVCSSTVHLGHMLQDLYGACKCESSEPEVTACYCRCDVRFNSNFVEHFWWHMSDGPLPAPPRLIASLAVRGILAQPKKLG